MQRSLLLRRLPAWMRRTLAGRLLGLLLPTAALLAQETAIRSAPDTKITTEVRVFASAREAVPKVTERGAHHRVEQWVERIIGADGATNDVTHSYTVLANGMNYLDGGEWKETVAEFVPVKGGWLAGRGPHQVLVSDDLFVAGAVTVVSPEGQTWKSTPMTLALRDRASGQVWVLGESRATRGELVAANTVLFRDAFASEAGLRADVRVVTSAGGVECDVIVRSGVPSREALGEAGEQAELVVLTEIFEPGGATANPVDRGGRSDDVVRLGALTMDQGQAFGTDLPGEPTRSVPVFKRVYQDEPSGRVFLEEATPLDSLSPLLEALPEARLPGPVEARWRNTAGNAVLPVRPIGLLPAPAFPRRADGRFEVAANKTGVRTFAAVKATPGVVLDWSYLNSATNFTFRGNTTYYVTNLVLLSGTNVTFEGGSVVKMSGDSAAGLQVNSGTVIQWLGEPYLPISLTAKDDDSIGDKITGSTSQPGGNRYGGTYLFLNSPGAAALVQHVRFRYARTAFGAGSAFSPNTVTLRHAQVTACEAGFRFQYGGTTNANYLLQNVLLANAGTAFKDFYQARTDAAFVTFDTVTNWFASTYSPHSSTVVANDSILAAVGSVNVGFTNNCWVASGGSGLFEAVGAGAYYLPRESAVRSVTPQVEVIPPPETLLAGMSTRAPYLWTNVVTVATNLDAVVHAWVGVPPEEEAIGYHYPKLHFLCTNVVVTNAVLTLTNGVSVGFAGTVGFALKSGAVFRSTGKPDNLNRLVWAGLVQESATYTALTNTSSALFTVTAGASRPGIEARFTELIFSNPGKTLVSDTANALAALTLRDCNLFRGHAYVLPPATTSSQTISLINRAPLETPIFPASASKGMKYEPCRGA